jgi:hypothetical protein
MMTILTVVLVLYSIWVLGHLLMMIFIRPDIPHFNGFSVYLPEWIEEYLTEEEYRAFWFHEKGHQLHWHVWENFLLICRFKRQTGERRWEQETEADDHAFNMGYGIPLAHGLRKLGYHPFDNARARRLELKELNRQFNEGEE